MTHAIPRRRRRHGQARRAPCHRVCAPTRDSSSPASRSSDQKRLEAAAAKFGGRRRAHRTRSQLAAEIKPDVFCFCTPPNVRLPLIELGIESGAKLIAFEKPVAMTSAEGIAIKRALDAAGVKAVVSHQHRYGDHYQKVK